MHPFDPPSNPTGRTYEKPVGADLSGRYVALRRLDPARDSAALADAAAGDPELWTYLPYGPFEDEAGFGRYLAWAAAQEDPLFYALCPLPDGRAAGVASYLRIEPAHRVIEIGHIWFGLALRRSSPGTEAIYLLARHAFDDLGYRRLEWKCDALNARSRRAAERFGFTFEGIFRKHMIVKGRDRDTAWFAIVDDDWPALRERYERDLYGGAK